MNYNFEIKKDGFQILKNVFRPEEIDKIRITVEKIFNTDNQTAGDNKNVRWDFFNLYPDLRYILFNSVIVNSLREILGQDFLVLDDMVMLRSGFGRWHKDTSTLEFYQNNFHYKKDYQMITVIIYLQDNNEYGGGLDVIPKSHLQNYDELVTPLNGGKKDFYYYIKRIKPKMISLFLNFCEKFLHKKIDLKKNIKFTIPSLKGDVILFDMRLEHKASWPIKNRKDQPDKLALTFTTGRNNVYTKEYMNFLKKRKDFKHLDNHSFKKDFLDECKKNGINLYF